MKIRRVNIAGEMWFNENDLKVALNDDEYVKQAATMMMVAKDKGDDVLECVRKGLAWFYTEATGALEDPEYDEKYEVK